MNEQVHADVMLGARLTYSDLASSKRSHDAVLLSGATGFLGAFLLQELLVRRRTSKVICLVRARDSDHAMMNITAAMRSYNLDESRLGDVSAVAADISRPSMGLPLHSFDELAGTIDTVIHAAAHVNLVLPYRIMRKSNVLGTYELLRLSSTGVKKSFHFVSSVAAFGVSANRTYHEEMAIPQSSAFVSGYAQSKWVSEQLVATSASRGLHACIYRPGLITGHSKTGVWHKRDALSLKLFACMRLRTVPVEKGDISMTPIDFVSTAIEKLAGRADSVGKAFHLVNRRAVSWERVTGALIAGGYVDKAVPYPDWVVLLRDQSDADPGDVDLARAASLFSMITPSVEEETTPDIDDTNTRKALRIDGEVPWPCGGTELLPRYLEWLSAQG
jgi:myxalamid-type nonribosomal peptide synthetase MxaA